MTSRELGLDHSWKWQARAGRWVLVTDQTRSLVLCGKDFAHIETSGPEGLQRLSPSDMVARIIAAAPDVRRHAQALIHGFDLGIISIEETEACGFARVETDPLPVILDNLRAALAKAAP